MFDQRGRRCGRGFARSYALHYANDGAAELDPRFLRNAVRAALAQFKSSEMDRTASSAFWHGLLGLDDKRRPLTPVYTWADSRCRSDAEQLRGELPEETILQRTGCMLRFAYWPAKLRWLRRTNRALFRRVKFWVSPADWILHEFFGELATSESMASGTGLFDQQSRCWDSELCDAVNISVSQLPLLRKSIDGGKILTAIGDGAASNLGSGATSEHVAAANLGTSAAIRVTTRRRVRIPAGLFRYIVNDDAFVIGGAISNAGNLHDWCRRELRTASLAPRDRRQAATDTLLALPFCVAERAPDWPEVPGSIVGLDPATTGAEISRALITSTLYRLTDIFGLLEQSLGRISRIIVSGGLSKSPETVAIFADTLGRDLEVASETEASLRGAALHALRLNGCAAPESKRGRVIRCDKKLTRKHQRRREKQQQFLTRLSSDP